MTPKALRKELREAADYWRKQAPKAEYPMMCYGRASGIEYALEQISRHLRGMRITPKGRKEAEAD